MSTLTTCLLWFAALGSALLGGVYFAFSAFIMRALRDAGHAGTASMNAINRVILRSAFMPLFFLTTIAAATLAVLGFMNLEHASAPMLIGGGVLYVAGMFVVTLFGNVPLNNALQNVITESRTGTAIWNDYLRRWTRWNHLRAASSLAAAALFIWALLKP